MNICGDVNPFKDGYVCLKPAEPDDRPHEHRFGPDPKLWNCAAYGPEGLEHGALCFFAEPHERTCGSEVQCRAVLLLERQRIFDRIQELAAAGDPVAAGLAKIFTTPDQLLSGPAD